MRPHPHLLAALLVSAASASAVAAEPSATTPAASPLDAPASAAAAATATTAPEAAADEAAAAEATDPNALEPAEEPSDDLPVQFSGEERYGVAPIVVVSGPRQPPPPTGVRVERRLALLGELGWNGLSGFGPSVVYHATPHISFDFGAGISLTGWKVGLRGRYNLLKKPLTPFIGVGFMGTSGFGSAPAEFTNEEGDQFAIKVKPSSFVQAVLGLDYTSPRGFTLVTAAGYAWLLNENLTIVSGEPTEEEQQALDFVFGSSLVLSVAIGYSFK